MRGGAGGVFDYTEQDRLQKIAQKKAEKKYLVDEFNDLQEQEWEDAGSPGGRPPKRVRAIPRGWQEGMPTGWQTRLPAPRKSRASNTSATKRGPALPPGFTRRDQWANLPVSKKMKGPEPLPGFQRRRQWANLPITKGMKGPKGPKGNYYGINAHKAPKQKGLTLPPGVSLRSTKAAKASLFQPKGLPAPAAALPKIQPKALPKYRAAKAAKAKTPRKKAAPKPPKCVNGVVHVKAYTRKCGTKKKATTQAGKGIWDKIKKGAKTAAAVALPVAAAAAAYKLGSRGYNNARQIQDYAAPLMAPKVGVPTLSAYKQAYKMWKMPKPWESQSASGRRKATPKRRGRGIGSKIKEKLKTTAKIAVPVLGALAAAHYLGPKAIKKWGPASAYQKALDKGLSPYGIDMLGDVTKGRHEAWYK